MLAGGAAAVVVLGVAGALIGFKLLSGPTDPGCKVYAGAGLTAYNKLIGDLNGRASLGTLDTDMTAAIAGLTSAASQAQSASAKSALSGLLSELDQVRTDIPKGSVPPATVNALNAASSTADSAC